MYLLFSISVYTFSHCLTVMEDGVRRMPFVMLLKETHGGNLLNISYENKISDENLYPLFVYDFAGILINLRMRFFKITQFYSIFYKIYKIINKNA